MKYLFLLSLICLAFSKKSFMSHNMISHKADACFSLYNPSTGGFLCPYSPSTLFGYKKISITSVPFRWCFSSSGKLYNGGICLNIPKSSASNPLVAYTNCASDTKNELWILVSSGSDSKSYYIKSKMNSNLCVTLVNEVPLPIAYVQTCRNDKSQLWQKN